MQLSKTHLQFSLLLFLKWLPSALFWHYYSLIVWSALSISIYGFCSPSLFHITILFRYAAAVQNRFSLFTFAFCLTVLFSLPFSHPELTLQISLLLSFLRVRFSLPFSHHHSLLLCCSCRWFNFHFCFLLDCVAFWLFSSTLSFSLAMLLPSRIHIHFFTFAFFRMVFSSGPFLPTLLINSVAFLPLFHITTLLMSSTHSLCYCCPKQMTTFTFF